MSSLFVFMFVLSILASVFMMSSPVLASPPLGSPALIAYKSNTVSGVNFPKYRTWSADTNSWSAESELATAGSPVRWVRTAWCPNVARKDERIVAVLCDDGNLYAYVWTGTAWSKSTIGSTGTTVNAYRAFDIAYEKTSGKALVVYSTGATGGAGTEELAYRIWDGVSWTAVTKLEARTGGAVNWIALASNATSARPGTGDYNDIAMIYIDSAIDVHGYIWTGSAWSEPDTTVWDATAAIASEECIAVAYEQSTGEAMFIWADTTGTDYYYRTWDGTTLAAATLLDIAATAVGNWVSLKSRPGSDDLIFGVVCADTDLNTRYWNGGSWDGATEHPEHDTGVDTHASRCFDVEWEAGGAYAILAYGTASGSISWKKFDPTVTGTTRWVVTGTTTSEGTHPWIQLRRPPYPIRVATDKAALILGATLCSTFDIDALQWNGIALTATTDLTTDTVVSTYECFAVGFQQINPKISTFPQKTMIHKPNLEGSLTGWTPYPTSPTTRYDKIDEYPIDDGDQTYVKATATALDQTVNLEYTASLTWKIARIRVVIVARQTTGDEQVRLLLYFGSPLTKYLGNTYTPTTTNATYISEWTLNPATNAIWTWSDIDTLQAGFTSIVYGTWSGEIRVTQIYLEVDTGDATYLDTTLLPETPQNLNPEADSTYTAWDATTIIKPENNGANTAWTGTFTDWDEEAPDYDTTYVSDTLRAIILRPNDNGTYTAWTGYARDWDDVTPDGNATFASATAHNLNETSQLEDHPSETTPFTPTKVRLHIVAAQFNKTASVNVPDRDDKVRLMLYIGGVGYNGSLVTPTTTYSTYTYDWATNPAGGSWTWSAIDTLQAGVRSQKVGTYMAEIRVTQLYITVDHVNRMETSSLSNPPGIPGSITKVRVVIVARTNITTNEQVQHMLRIAGSNYFGTATSLTTRYKFYTYDWATNPAGGSWTWQNIVDLEAGVKSVMVGATWEGEIRVTQLHVEVFVTTTGADYTFWDDWPNPDGDGTGISTTADAQYESSTLSDPSTYPTWTIAKVKVCIVARSTNSTNDEVLYPFLTIDGIDYDGLWAMPTGTYRTYTSEWAVNPDTLAYWTWGDIKKLEVGVRSQQVGSYFDGELRITQLYVEVTGPRLTVDINIDYIKDLWLYQIELTFNLDVIKGVVYDPMTLYPVEQRVEPKKNGPFLASAGGGVSTSKGSGWNNTHLGKLWVTGAYTDQNPLLCPDGNGILATVFFEVIGKGRTDIRLGELTGVQGPGGNWIVQGRAYVEDGSFQNMNTADIPTASFTLTHPDTPVPLEGFNTTFTSTSTAPGGKTITTHKWYFWRYLQEVFYGFPNRTLLLKPNGAGSHSDWTGAYTDWYDWPNPDGDTTKVYTSADKKNQTSNLQDHTTETWTITRVRLTLVAKNTLYSDEKIVPMIRVGTTQYYGPVEYTPIPTYKSYTADWWKNPATDSAWTWSAIDALQAGVASKQLGATWTGELRVTQMYIEVTGSALEDPYVTVNSASSVVTHQYQLRGTWPVTLTVIDSGSVVGSTTVDVLVRAHDVAVVETRTQAAVAKFPSGTPYIDYGQTLKANVTVENQGNYDETFDLSAYWLDPYERRGGIGTQSVTLGTEHLVIRPNDNGGDTAWAGTFTDWDDSPADDGDTTYVSTTSGGQHESSQLQNHGTESWTILSVRLNIIAKNTLSSDEIMQPMLVIGGTRYYAAKFTPTTAYTKYTYIWTANPAGGSWDWGTIDNLQAGVKSELVGTWTGELRVTQLYVEVSRKVTMITFNWNTAGMHNLTAPDAFSVNTEASIVLYEYDKGDNSFVYVGPRIRGHNIAVTEVERALALSPDGDGSFTDWAGGYANWDDWKSSDGDTTVVSFSANLRPNENGYYTDWTGTYTDWSEVTPDGNATYVSATAHNWNETSNIQDHTTETSTITKVRLTILAWQARLGDDKVRLMLYIGGIGFNGSLVTPVWGAYSAYSFDWATNPAGGSWTWSAIDSLQAGVRSQRVGATMSEIRVTQLYVTVTAYRDESSTLEDHPTDTGLTWSIAKVRLNIVAKNTHISDEKIVPMLVIGSPATRYFGALKFTPTTRYENYTYEWTLNPATSALWTWSAINSLEAGVRAEQTGDAWDGELRVTQLYLEVVPPACTTHLNITQGEKVHIRVTVTDLGDFNQTNIDVSAKYDGTIIGTIRVGVLSNLSYSIFPGSKANYTATLVFMWDTSGDAYGRYTITGTATVASATPEGKPDGDPSDNTKTLPAATCQVIILSPAVPEFPLGGAIEIALVAILIYMWRRTRTKPKKSPYPIKAKL